MTLHLLCGMHRGRAEPDVTHESCRTPAVSACCPLASRSPSGERAEGDLIRAARRRPPAIPQHGRGLRRYRRGHYGYKLQLGKVTSDHDRASRDPRGIGRPAFRAGIPARVPPSLCAEARIMPPSAVPLVKRRPLPQPRLLMPRKLSHSTISRF
jgi:hypothetical protein